MLISPSAASTAHSTRVDFRREPLRWFDQTLPTAGDTFWLPSGMLCVAEPEAAKTVLANADGLFHEHSDFFHTKRGAFGPRSLQTTLARGGRQLFADHVTERLPALPSLVAEQLVGTSEWPDAGNHLIHRYLASALASPEARERLAPLFDLILERGVLAGARERRSKIARFFFRRRVFKAFTRELERRIADPVETPRDLFDVLATCAGPEARTEELAELYMPFFFAVVGSVGFTLGWSIYLLGTEPPTRADSAWVVREALRLWPIAWQLGRPVAETHTIADVEVEAGSMVLVSPYVTQRHPAYWSEPTRFRPERWAEQRDHKAFLPFGWGPHTCAAAALSLHVVQDVLDVLRNGYELRVEPHSDRPFTGPSLAPPPYRLTVVPQTPTARERR